MHLQKTPKSPGSEFKTPPLVRKIFPRLSEMMLTFLDQLVLNNFSVPGSETPKELKLLTTMFQNMFPPIQVQSVSYSRLLIVLNLTFR